jgi:hypothetical protein
MRSVIAIAVLNLVCALFANVALASEHEKVAPIEGAWRLVSANWPDGKFPGDHEGALLKIYSKHSFAFVGRTRTRSGSAQDRFGGGTFDFDGTTYSESIQYHCVPALVGETIRFHLVITGDTMTLTGPLTSSGEQALGFRLEEVYERTK